MASSLALVALLAVGLSCASADTCDGCKSTYDTAVASAADNAAKCALALTYSTCLLDATGAGCDAQAAEVTALQVDMNSYNSPVGTCVTLRAPCLCELAFNGATKLTTATTSSKCIAAAVYTACTFAQTDASQSCATTTINSNLKYRARVGFSDYCQCSGHAIRFSVATLLFVVVGWFLKN